MQVKSTYVCPKCHAGFNVPAESAKPEKCPACGYRFVASDIPFRYRMPKSLFQQFRQIVEAAKSSIPPYVPTGEETDNEPARKAYMDRESTKLIVDASNELIEFMDNQPDEVILDFFRTCEFFVEYLGSLSSDNVKMQIPHICARMHAICENVLAGKKIGVRYGAIPTRPASGSSS